MFFIFVLALIWGSLSAQFLLQTITALIGSLICLTAIPFSKVSKLMNAGGGLALLLQAIIFGALFVGGNWFSSYYIIYDSYDTASIASMIAFVLTFICMIPQIPGKILLNRMSA